MEKEIKPKIIMDLLTDDEANKFIEEKSREGYYLVSSEFMPDGRFIIKMELADDSHYLIPKIL